MRTQAADAVVRLSLLGLPTPCKRDSVEAAGRVVMGLESLPSSTLRGEPEARLAERLDGCAKEIGQETVADAQASLEVVEDALRVASDHAPLKARQVAMKRALADRLVKEQPLHALALYVEIPDTEAMNAAQALIDTFGEAPSLWLEASGPVEKWLVHPSQNTAWHEKVALYRSKLEAARATHARDEALIAEGDEAKLVRALKASPGNQELAVAVANLARVRGDAEGALATLKALGPVGLLTGEARLMLGVCHRDLGQLAEADAVLSSFVSASACPPSSACSASTTRRRTRSRSGSSRGRAEGQLPTAVAHRLDQATGHGGGAGEDLP